MRHRLTRRRTLLLTGRAALGVAMAPRILRSTDPARAANACGIVIGETTAAGAGVKILAQGGNAIDAAVAAALAAAVASPNNCGLAGYGGHMMIALAGGKKITAIDFNTAAPAAASADMFGLDEDGAVRERGNEFGWRACGVPGTLAGLQLAIDRYATKSFRELAAPALELARSGFSVSQGLANASRSMAARLKKDPGSAKLLLKNGEPYRVGETFRNPDLANVLETLAKENSVEPFYRGAIARGITAAFQANGGLLTDRDLSEYQACEVEPLRFDWRGCSVFTAPLTAGGLTVVEALSILKALNWAGRPPDPMRAHARVEALRFAWRDRLQLLGDPEKTQVPVSRLLSVDYTRDLAQQIESAIPEKKALPIQVESRSHGGTVHLSSVDGQGNMAGITLTHGNTFGACVTVDGLGLTFGHGLSRFEPRPGHANSIGPGKRPLHNMCPTVVVRDGHPVLTLGGAGGRRIVNGVFDTLLPFVALDASMEAAVAAPRLHTEGSLELRVERQWPEPEVEYFKSLGFEVLAAPGAKISAVSFDPKSGECRAASR
ncbi:MAG: gamma-glutamyltransferase [Verrucomicrobia bacterium]|nr:gamma-glutamyltransferase [Verrucomicrobiota bacterium]